MAKHLWIFVMCCFSAHAARPLGQYDVDLDWMSVSGLSSGASMATQMHVAYSGKMMGVGMFAGSPYWCAQGSLISALGACMTSPGSVNMAAILAQTISYASSGEIDNTNNMNDDKVFIFHGTQDGTVVPGLLPRVNEFYSNFINQQNIRTVSNIPAGHGMPTSHYGNACGATSSPWINNCGYNGAYEMLNFLFDNELTEPSYGQTLPGDFYTFDQSEFFLHPPSISSMDEEGFVYVPSGCMDDRKKASSCDVNGPDREDCGFPGITPSECVSRGCCWDDQVPMVPWCFEEQEDRDCAVHIVFHGCNQGKHLLGDQYARNAGYNEVGEANNIIMLYPQAVSSLSNPQGCWDWWGYNFPNVYATKIGHQALATCRMLEKLTGGTGEPCPEP